MYLIKCVVLLINIISFIREIFPSFNNIILWNILFLAQRYGYADRNQQLWSISLFWSRTGLTCVGSGFVVDGGQVVSLVSVHGRGSLSPSPPPSPVPRPPSPVPRPPSPVPRPPSPVPRPPSPVPRPPSPVPRPPSPVPRHPSPVTRHPSPVTRHPSPSPSPS